MRTKIVSQNKTVFGNFDLVERDQHNPKQILGWSCNLLDKKGFRVLGEYETPEIAKNVIDAIISRENELEMQFMKKAVFRMPEPDGITKL